MDVLSTIQGVPVIPGDVLLGFFAASVILALAPGPDNIFVLTQSALTGRLSGIATVLGLCTGLVAHTAAVALGVAGLVQGSESGFTLLKFAGACYLLYLAWHAFRASAVTLAAGGGVRHPGAGRLYGRGIIMNITNPKVSLFFIAFLPQFADPERGSVMLQLLILGGVFVVSTCLVFGSIALLAGTLGPWMGRSVRAQRVMHSMAGVVFVVLALSLVASER